MSTPSSKAEPGRQYAQGTGVADQRDQPAGVLRSSPGAAESAPQRLMIDTPEKLKETRKRLGWTQAQLAEELGMSRESVNSMELGRRPIMPRTQRQLQAIVDAAPEADR